MTGRRIIVLISEFRSVASSAPSPTTSTAGAGTNLQALIDAHIVLVLSNRKATYGLTRSQGAGPPILARYLALQPYLKGAPDRTRMTYDAEIARIVLETHPDIIVLAGWMHVVGDGFLDAVGALPVSYLDPALPGAFDGTNRLERSYVAFQKGKVDIVSAMEHRVDKGVDLGEPVVEREVEIKKDGPLEEYEWRLHRAECETIVEATRKVLDEVRPM